jgi:hypothetical protein
MFANSTKTRPTYDSNIEEVVYMTSDIAHVLWRSDHVFKAGANARKAAFGLDAYIVMSVKLNHLLSG